MFMGFGLCPWAPPAPKAHDPYNKPALVTADFKKPKRELRKQSKAKQKGLRMERRSRDERMAGGAGAGPRGPPGRPLPPPPSFPQSRGPPPPPPRRFEPVDREKTCPLLLRVFTKNGGHHTQEDFAVRGKEPKDEVQIYTWKDATLRELTDLVKEIAPAARRRNAKLSFAFVYPDKRGCYVFKQAGMTHAHGNIGRRLDDSKSLNELKFQIGDYLDVAVL